MAALSDQRTRRIGETNQQEIRAQSTRATAALMAAATLLYWWSLLSERDPDFRLVVVSFALIPVFLVSYHLSDRRPWLAHGLLLTGCLAAAIESSRAVPLEALVPLLILPGIVALSISGAGSGLIITMLAIVLSPLGLRGPDYMTVAGVLFVLLVVVAVIRPRADVLEWSWRRSSEAIDLAEQLRDRQGELNKALSALHVAYQLLERSNRELAAAHQEAEEARRLKEEFAANVSHELRTPLNIILGFAEIMHRSPGTYGPVEWSPMLRRDVAEIWRSAGYISELVDDILELARVDALRMPVRREMTDLTAVVSETAQLAERLLEGKAVSLALDLEAGLPPLFLDRTRIRQVLLNLLTNAIRFTDTGTISVSAAMRDQDVLVTVADTGVGIAAHELELVFQEFHRAEGPGERGGKGLGLAIARRFVQLHGGRIWAESRLGAGSQFHFTLPLQEKWVSRLSGSLSASVPDGHSTPILVLTTGDDDRASAFLARHLDGYEVIPVGQPQEVPEFVNRHHPAAVVVEGPIPDAMAQADHLAESLPAGTPIIATSLPGPSTADVEDWWDALVGKPVTQEQLLEALHRFAESGSVMVVDDDRGFVQLIRRMLSASGEPFEVRWAYDGPEALAKLRSAPADVALVDMMMEPMTGSALAQAMREEAGLSGIPIIAVTGAAGWRDEARISWVQLTKRAGMRDAEALNVLRSLLGEAKAEYVSTLPSDAPRIAAGPGRQASEDVLELPAPRPEGDPGKPNTRRPGCLPSPPARGAD